MSSGATTPDWATGVAQAQAVFNNFVPTRRISVRDTQTGAVYTDWRRIVVPYPGEYSVEVIWKDRGGWHHFLPITYLIADFVAVVSNAVDKVTFLVVDGKPKVSNHWTCDLELEPPIYETVSWWRW